MRCWIGFRRRRLKQPAMALRTLTTVASEGDEPMLMRPNCTVLFTSLLLLLLVSMVPPALARRGKNKISYGEGLIVNIPLPESEVEQVVEEVAQDGVIRGTKEYNKDEFVAGAKAADSSHVFPAWEQGGRVIYKVRTEALDPRNFKDSGDVGTLVVRYVVSPQGKKNTVLRIDALFEEDFRRVVHQSNGSVETAEYKDIREHLDSIEVMKAQNVEALRERQEMLAKKQNLAVRKDAADTPVAQAPVQSVPQAVESSSSNVESGSDNAVQAPPPVASEAAMAVPAPVGQTLEQQIKDVKKQVERLVKQPGAPLKSAPFHTAGTLQLLTPGTEVLILISTPYWYGIETHEGQHGWMERDQLELLP
ncbi:MAG: hypothetical protein WAL52_17055 [Candidatus Sulfotelmatobacter sp.]